MQLIPFLFVICWPVYLGYYVIWRLATVPGRAPHVAHPSTLRQHKQNCIRTPQIPAPDQSHQHAATSHAIRTADNSQIPAKPSLRPVDWQILARQEILQQKSWLNWATQLSRSLCVAAFVTAIISLLSFIVATSVSTNSPTFVPGTTYAWIYFTTLLSSWSLLAISQAYHGREIDPVLKRFRQLVVGLLVAAVAYHLCEWLYYRPTYLVSIPSGLRHQWTEKLYDSQGHPTAYAFLGYFAGLFSLVRWWRFTDPLRAHRMELRPTFLVSLLAAAWNVVLPMPLGVLVATSIALTLQLLSAPWINDLDRQRMREQAQQTLNVPSKLVVKV
ncbi:MAG: hypothetical protein O2931_04955 [Planctomycetota bacterium]|nr:hypothetical protein [Planctomycetota bacterium]